MNVDLLDGDGPLLPEDPVRNVLVGLHSLVLNQRLTRENAK